MRIFIGIDLDPEVRARIERFIEGVHNFAPDARWVRPELLHITLKFVGEQTPEQVEAITERLRRIESRAFEIRCGGYGFFPTARAARVFWIGIHAGPQLATLAANIDMTVAELGVPREDRAFSPHLTLARGGGRSGSPKPLKGDVPNQVFAVLEKRLVAIQLGRAGTPVAPRASLNDLDFGTMTAREFILYQSQLSAGGSRYAKLQRFRFRPFGRE